MSKIPSNIRHLIEQSIYLPMTATVLNKDMNIVKKSPFKLKDPYLHLIEEALKLVQKDLAEVRKELRRQKVKVLKAKQDEAFTTYTFYYNGYEEHHSYFNPRIRNKVNELIEHYLFKTEKKSGIPTS
ncbi:hypothetical protein NST97_18015 [Aeribacillus sp. FSL K6-1305]|uniref:hypothetical protein n=1 Tax=Aeribacillus sp. FSL K6-1305 TaxID=2954569 RepID=UPI0030FD80B5